MSRIAAAAAVVVLTASGCGYRGLNFQQDRRVRIVSPRDRAKVDLPVTVRWRYSDFRTTGLDGATDPDAGYFALLVDRAPQPPGETLDSLFRDDEFCQRTQGCPDLAYMQQSLIFPTTLPSVRLEHLTDNGARTSKPDVHEATVVLLNGRGERIGESAFRVQFTVNRDR